MRTFSHGAPIVDAAISDDRRTSCTAGSDGLVKIWPLGGGEPRVLRHGAPLTAVALRGAVGLRLQAGTESYGSGAFADGKLLRPSKHPAPVLDVAFDSTGRANRDRRARTGSGASGSNGRVVHQLVGHTDDVTSIAFGPHGGTLITASRDHVRAPVERRHRGAPPDVRVPLRDGERGGDQLRRTVDRDRRPVEIGALAGPRRQVAALPAWPPRVSCRSATFAPGGHRIVTGVASTGRFGRTPAEECGTDSRRCFASPSRRLDQARER